MPAPRMRAAAAPQPLRNLHPHFEAVSHGPLPPRSVSFPPAVAELDDMEIDHEPEKEPVSNHEELYLPWQQRLFVTMSAIVTESSERSQQALECAEKVYHRSWSALQGIYNHSSLPLAGHEALFVRNIDAFKVYWARILSEPVDPFRTDVKVEVAQEWLDKWFNLHKVFCIFLFFISSTQ